MLLGPLCITTFTKTEKRRRRPTEINSRVTDELRWVDWHGLGGPLSAPATCSQTAGGTGLSPKGVHPEP